MPSVLRITQTPAFDQQHQGVTETVCGERKLTLMIVRVHSEPKAGNFDTVLMHGIGCV